MGRRGVKLFLGPAMSGGTVGGTIGTGKSVLKVSLVVTPVLTVFNHAHEIIVLELGARFYLQTLLTFCVPYLVSTFSSAMTEMQNTPTDSAPGPVSEGEQS